MTDRAIHNHVLIQWLASEDALVGWMDNVNKEYTNATLYDVHNNNPISGLFGWYTTPEGEDYWHDLYVRWRKVVPKITTILEETNETRTENTTRRTTG